MKTFVAVSALALFAGAASADVITQWNFNSAVADASTATGTTLPSIGAGTASLLGTTATFASGDASGGSTDPNVGDDSAWNLTSFPAQGVDSGTEGAAFFVSTVGFFDVVISFDQRHSNTSSRFFRLDYTVDGGTSWSESTVFEATAGDTWFNGRTADLSAVTAVDNNPNFGFRIVSIFAPGTSAYAASSPTGTYGATGTARFDMVTVSGVIPTPGALALMGLGGLIAARRRRA